MPLIQRRFYLPVDTYDQLARTARSQGKSTTELLRELLKEGLRKIRSKNYPSPAQGLLKIAERAEKEHWGKGGDVAKNHNQYFIEAYERSH